MARVFNWQIGRIMSYWYGETRPAKQFAAVFDLNKCIACQTCTLACKTTWTSGRGQEYMLWNNVESKPYGSYPLAYDSKILEMLGPQEWVGERYEGRTVFEAAPAGERLLGYRPESGDYSYPNIGEDEIFGTVDGGMSVEMPHPVWMFYLPRICNHCTYPACLAACPRGSIYKRPEDGIVLIDQKRCRGYRECVRACPYKKTFFNSRTGVSEKCIACFPLGEQDEQPRCFTQCIGKIRLRGWISVPEKANENNPIDYLVHVKKVALPLFPQLGLEPNVYYIPPIHVPNPFLNQLFGPLSEQAVQTYRNAHKNEPKLAALINLFGCTPKTVAAFKTKGNIVSALNDNGDTLVAVPVREPVAVRPAFDTQRGVPRMNVT
ncbi:MAG: dehydrogenase [Candidatus Abyssobacteria bacterium SURF_5]|uniref:Dehydrogenase n=1 Tax=Abyssobacteria bacterium (strain SURF_5) TaxID=2093360 RepID=A0A3A4P3G1_ABYX5|nr:MAG: dehydrogenase [Candidatus Abyssubacteria bacterium SURF_5]